MLIKRLLQPYAHLLPILEARSEPRLTSSVAASVSPMALTSRSDTTTATATATIMSKAVQTGTSAASLGAVSAAISYDSSYMTAETSTTNDSTENLYLRFGTTTTSSGTDADTDTDSYITVIYTETSQGGTLDDISFSVIIPTITTDTLPTTNSVYLNSTLSHFSNSSISSSLYLNDTGSSSISRRVSSHVPAPTTTPPKSTLPLKSSSLPPVPPPRTSLPLSSLSSSSSPSPPPPTPTTSSHTSTKQTLTVTEYLEVLTYTQVYVVTGSETTLTTDFLQTTSFYISNQASVYSISPPAITTDFASFKSLEGYNLVLKKKLSGGAIAGISVGSILGAILAMMGVYLFLKSRRNNRKRFDTEELPHNRSIELNSYDPFFVEDRNDSDSDFDSHGINSSDAGHTQSPAIPDRAKKQPYYLADPPLLSGASFSQQPTRFLESKESNDTVDVDIDITGDGEDSINDVDMGLFDLKSEFNAINSSTDTNNYLLTPLPLPSSRKTSNGIDKMNYKVENATPSPRMSMDRTMGVLYESPNEQCVWDEFHGAKDAGVMVQSELGSPIGDSFLFDNHDNYEVNVNSNYDFHKMDRKLDYKDKYHQRTRSLSNSHLRNSSISNSLSNDDCVEFDDSFKTRLFRSNRVGSGSSLTRYDYLKERIQSPLSSNECDDTHNNNNGTKSNRIPPPVPKPRKTFDIANTNHYRFQ